MNQLILSGNLAKDPVTTTVNGNKTVTNISVAVQKPFANDKGEYEAEFFNLSVWGKAGEYIQRNKKKGSEIALRGYVYNKRTVVDGVTNYSVCIGIEGLL